MAKTDFKLKYQGSVFGYLWSLMSPLLLFGILYLVFTRVVRFGSVHNYAAMLIINIMLFQFFGEATTRAMTSIVGREALVRKMEFPRLVIPLSIVLASTFTLGLDLVVVFAFLVFVTGVPVLTTWLLLPVLILWLYAFTVGTALRAGDRLRALPRHRADLDGDLAGAVLRLARPLPDRALPAGLEGAPGAQPARPAVRPDARLDGRPERAHLLRGAGRGGLLDLSRCSCWSRVLMLGAWLFDREAPRVAEQL